MAAIIRGRSRTRADGQKSNLILWSEEFDNAAWTGSASVTADSATSPRGSTSADTLTDNSTSAHLNKLQTVTVPNDTATYTISVGIQKDADETRFPEFQNYLNGGTAVVRHVQVNTATGDSTARTASGVTSHVVRDAGDYWRLEVTLTNNASGNTSLNLAPHPALSTTLGAADVTTTGAIVVWGAQANRGPKALPYIKTTDRAR